MSLAQVPGRVYMAGYLCRERTRARDVSIKDLGLQDPRSYLVASICDPYRYARISAYASSVQEGLPDFIRKMRRKYHCRLATIGPCSIIKNTNSNNSSIPTKSAVPMQ
jgi:hypothetical protein